jgi:hypothetical protein
MPDEIRTCMSCFTKFKVTERELEEAKTPGRGLHHPRECPEGLDLPCPTCDMEVYGPEECKSCRIKQDGQRS